MLKLYYAPRTRALRPRWLMEELGLSYELERVDIFAGEGQSKAYKAIHPHGQVPALAHDGGLLIESGAICAWLADCYGLESVAPRLDTPERAAYNQWMYYAPGTLEPPLFDLVLHTMLLPEQQRIPEVARRARRTARRLLKHLDDLLATRAFLAGDRFTTADIMVGSTLMWQPGLFQGLAKLSDYVAGLRARPAYERAVAD